MPYALSVLHDAFTPCGRTKKKKRKTTIRHECVCPNKRIKGPLCLWEDDWWGRDLTPSLSLWADPAFESCGARPTHTDGLQSRSLSRAHTHTLFHCLFLPVQFILIQGFLSPNNPIWDFQELPTMPQMNLN